MQTYENGYCIFQTVATWSWRKKGGPGRLDCLWRACRALHNRPDLALVMKDRVVFVKVVGKACAMCRGMRKVKVDDSDGIVPAICLQSGGMAHGMDLESVEVQI